MRYIKYITPVIVVLISLVPHANCFSQTLRVDDARVLSDDLSASLYPRNDYNGRACALVKVAFPIEGAEFEGNVIGATEYKAGEYWVYLTAESKFLKIKHAEFSPLMIQFNDSTVGPVGSKIVYGVKVSAGSKYQKQWDDFRQNVEQDFNRMVENGIGVEFMPIFIFFEPESADLPQTEQTQIDKLITIMKKDSKAHVEITVGTDNKTGSPRYHQSLRELRYYRISNALLEQGIESSRISFNNRGGVLIYSPNICNEVAECQLTRKSF